MSAPSSSDTSAQDSGEDIFYEVLQEIEQHRALISSSKKQRSQSSPELSNIQDRKSSVSEGPSFPQRNERSRTKDFPVPSDKMAVYEQDFILKSLVKRFEFLVAQEKEQQVKEYLTRSYEVTPVMRASLINWLYKVTIKFRLEQETFHNAVCIVDFYLSKNTKFPREDLHLLGLTALYIGSKKYDEYTLTLKNLVPLLNNRSEEDMLKMENKLLQSCFKIKPLLTLMLKQLCKIGKVNIMTFTVASYIIDIAVQTHRNIGLPPPYLASGALFLAFIVMDNEDGWIKELMMSTGFSKKSMLLNCTVEALQMSCEENSEDKELEAVRTKYLSNQYEEEQNLAGLSTYIEKIWDLEL